MDPDQAREFLVERVVRQADHEGKPLRSAELQLLLMPDAEPPVDSSVIEAKLSSLISRTAAEVPVADAAVWQEAADILEGEGTYLSLLLIASRHVVDWSRTRRRIIYAVLILIAVNYLTRYASRWI